MIESCVMKATTETASNVFQEVPVSRPFSSQQRYGLIGAAVVGGAVASVTGIWQALKHPALVSRMGLFVGETALCVVPLAYGIKTLVNGGDRVHGITAVSLGVLGLGTVVFFQVARG